MANSKKKSYAISPALFMLATILVVVGALNWGLVAWFGVDLVAMIAGATMPIIGTILYSAVALSAIWVIVEVANMVSK